MFEATTLDHTGTAPTRPFAYGVPTSTSTGYLFPSISAASLASKAGSAWLEIDDDVLIVLDEAQHLADGTGGSWTTLWETPQHSPELGDTLTLLAAVRADLSLNLSETARALGVERATVYAWLAERSIPRQANLIRLRRLAGVAASWRRLSARPLGELVRKPREGGKSIAEVLADDPLPERDIATYLAGASAALRGAKQPRVRVDEAARQLGIPLPDGSAGQDQVDWITRRSLGDEH